jgi:signal transduction histidine kinase
MREVTPEWLNRIDALKEVPLNQLAWFILNSAHYELKEGDLLFKIGDPVKGIHIVISGKIKLCMVQSNSSRELGILESGNLTGYMPYSRAKVAMVNGQVAGDTQVMTFPMERVREMISDHFELTEALVHVMTSRVREFTALQQQNEKMMALGKLSAGLAHELNNPAAAIVRGSDSLKKHLQLIPETFKKVISIRMTSTLVDAVNQRMFDVLCRKKKAVLPLMERTEMEEAFTDWLEERATENSFEIAENFVDFQFAMEDLVFFEQHIPPDDFSIVLNWINNNLVTEKMVNDIQEASQRISDLVASVKVFTHMDRSPDKQYSDIHQGLRNTLKMLQYKIRKGNVEVIENFDHTLPEVNAMIGELNQVWTNLIDNALDAMENQAKGKLEIQTEKDRDFVKVTISDNGPGISSEILSRIFDPFFTTKEIGKGTGLGLDVVMRIVKQHNGSVTSHSIPGRTSFIVCFPING